MKDSSVRLGVPRQMYGYHGWVIFPVERFSMEFVIAYLLVNVLVGVAACFFGKKLFYLMLGLLVFLGVFNIGLTSTDGSVLSLVIAAVLGVAAALLSKYVYKAGVFLVGFIAGAALGFVVTMLMPQEATNFLGVIMVVAGLLLGLAAAHWTDFAVRLGTAWTGASFVVPNVLAAVLAFGSLTAVAVAGDAMASFDALSAYIGRGTAPISCLVGRAWDSGRALCLCERVTASCRCLPRRYRSANVFTMDIAAAHITMMTLMVMEMPKPGHSDAPCREDAR